MPRSVVVMLSCADASEPEGTEKQPDPVLRTLFAGAEVLVRVIMRRKRRQLIPLMQNQNHPLNGWFAPAL